MALDSVVELLSKAMRGEWESIDPATLDEEERNYLTAYMVQREKMPELLEDIGVPLLVAEYLSSSPEGKNALQEFRLRHPEYMGGMGLSRNVSGHGRNILGKITLKSRLVNQLLRAFNFYLEHRADNQAFNQNYLIKHFKSRDSLGISGQSLCVSANTKLAGGLQEIVELAATKRPELLDHWNYLEMIHFDIEDAVNDLIRIYDFYLENHSPEENFNVNYCLRNLQLQYTYGRLGPNLYQNACNNLDGGMKELVEITAKIRPEILLQWNHRMKKFDIQRGAQDLIRLFDFYVDHRFEGQKFNVNYLRSNVQLRQAYGRLGSNLCRNSRRVLENGIQDVVDLASKTRPEILNHWKYNPQGTNHGT